MSGSLRVLHVIPTLDPRVGGTASAAVAAVVSERQQGMAVTVATTTAEAIHSRGGPARRLEDARVRLLAFPTDGPNERQSGLWGLSLRLVVWLLRHAGSYDVIHAHGVWSLSTAAAGLAGKLAGTPVVMTAHESLTRFDVDVASGSGLKRGAKLGMRRLLARLVDSAIFASDLELHDSIWERERSFVVPHAVVDEGVPRPVESGEDRTAVAYLGRLHPKKGIESLLAAMAAPGLRAADLIVCGDGDARYRQDLVSTAERLGISPRVEWRGHVDAEGRQRLFSEARVLAMPSAYECFGMVAAEAMASGVPVVVSETTGVAAAVDRHSCGAVVAAGDSTRLAGALAELVFADPDSLEEVRRRARGAVESEFTFSARGAAVERVYAELGRRIS